ncbi:hypothetical protein PFICI_06738 [Pestalotiopsis fici W106-1]|uniref:Rhamnogalacturonase A/B/Epimerase-like pectate lyase domain-containing protein n=1 Tax=Pestalotiopsis fici (strain W106-1 / CGMCC3.15140) TaxID=1229662 RepID=W3X9B6_PESFW|nr:uncharacterized protein PFICI_06738 [Pestalotiopsis fici W106-1]ETS81736.1 hypothetical protein PFICI_06738 [Pestalotiopsis fici W106-1]
MFLPLFSACLLALPLLASGSIDISAFIDDFLEQWKIDNPDLESDQLAQVIDTANTVKEAVLNPTQNKKRTSKHQSRAPYKPSHPHFRRQLANSTAISNSTLEEARALVLEAQKEANIRNRERFQNPRLNNYYDSFSTEAARVRRRADAEAFAVNSTVAAAAAMVAEADAATMKPVEYKSIPAYMLELSPSHGTESSESTGLSKRADSFWMEDIDHVGKVPFGGSENDDYVVFRNVKEYGAVGDGLTDDTEAINNAMKEGNRCGENCGGSTVKPVILYFPSGTYLVSSPIIAYYNTQMIGNANSLPIIKAAKSFVGLGVVSSDVYTGKNDGKDQWYINQNNFLRQLRNFVIDVTEADLTDCAGVHWQVAQATSIQNVKFYQSDSADKEHVGVFAENGSGGFMSDLQFFDGAVGIQCGNQQFTTRNMAFVGCRTAIDLLWDWGWTWKSLLISATEYAVKMSGDYRGGSIMFVDSTIINTPTGIYVTTPKGGTASEQFSITLDNIEYSSVGTMVNHETAGVSLAGGSGSIESWILGKVYDQNTPNGKYQSGGSLSALHPQTEELRGSTGFFEREKPQYADLDANTFMSAAITNSGRLNLGDGVTDDTFALAILFLLATRLGRPVYIPFGSYIVTQTVKIPTGARVVGECWAQIVARGAFFSDIDNPQVMIQVGEWGDAGVIEIQDLMLTTQGPTAGLVLMEWNVAQSKQGSAAMWDTHFRIGGAKGSQLQVANCPKLTGSVNPNCIAGAMMLHMTQVSSGYLENIWAWVADHDFDSGPDQTQIDIYVARGMLIESTGGPTWMYATASEHCILYQYQLYGAENVYMGMIQTESPYFLPQPQAPAPFKNQLANSPFPGDPDFSECTSDNPHCAAAWGIRIIGSTNVQILGAGLYNWFQEYTQPCVDSQDCQQRVANVIGSGNVWIYNLYTIGTVEMINLKDANPILSKDNTNTNEHPFTSIINAWLVASSGEGDLSVYDGTSDDDDYEEVVTDPNRSPCSAHYTSLDQIEENANRIPDYCYDNYLVDVELSVLNQALADYDDIVAGDYDSKFDTYERVTRQQVPASIDAYMAGAQASGNFRCTKNVAVFCCSDCTGPYGGCSSCDNSASCVDGQKTVDVDCPTVINDPYDIYSPSPGTITYIFTNEDKFYSEILDNYGVQRDWIKPGDRLAKLANGCQYQADPIECGKTANTWWHGYPIVDEITIPDPKEVISKSYDRSRALAIGIADSHRFAKYGIDLAGQSDLTDSVSLPALMMSSAVSNMRDVVKVADDAAEQERKEIIANFITGIFMLIPMAGELAGALGGATMKAIIGMAGELANVGLTIYEIIDSPGSALTTILGFAMGGGSIKPFRDAAKARRGMVQSEKDKLNPRTKVDLDRIDAARSACLRK